MSLKSILTEEQKEQYYYFTEEWSGDPDEEPERTEDPSYEPLKYLSDGDRFIYIMFGSLDEKNYILRHVHLNFGHHNDKTLNEDQATKLYNNFVWASKDN